MMRVKSRSGLLALALGIVSFANAAPNILREQAADAASRGKFEQAESFYRAALRSLSNKDSMAAVAIWNDLGALDHAAGHKDQARADFSQALALNARLPEPDANQQAIALNNLATIAGESRDYKQASKLLADADAVLVSHGLANGRTAALVRANEALTLQQQARDAEAAGLYARAAPEVKVLCGAQSAEYVHILINEGLLGLERGRYEQAATDSREALEAERALPYVSAYDRALTLNNLGFALFRTGRADAAKQYLEEAVNLWQTLPAAKEQLVSSLNNLGALEEERGARDSARAHELRALSIATGSPAVGDLIRAAVLTNLGRLEAAAGDRRQARRLFEDACSLSQNRGTQGQIRYAAALSNLAALASSSKHFKEAESLYRKTLASDQAALGEEHPEIASDLSNIATQLVYQKRRAEALSLYQRARAIQEKVYGPVSPALAHTWRNIAIVYYADRQFDESAFAYGKAIQTNPDQNVSSWFHEYANALRKAERFGEAEQAETRAVGIEVKNTLAAEKRAGQSGKL